MRLGEAQKIIREGKYIKEAVFLPLLSDFEYIALSNDGKEALQTVENALRSGYILCKKRAVIDYIDEYKEGEEGFAVIPSAEVIDILSLYCK